MSFLIANIWFLSASYRPSFIRNGGKTYIFLLVAIPPIGKMPKNSCPKSLVFYHQKINYFSGGRRRRKTDPLTRIFVKRGSRIYVRSDKEAELLFIFIIFFFLFYLPSSHPLSQTLGEFKSLVERNQRISLSESLVRTSSYFIIYIRECGPPSPSSYTTIYIKYYGLLPFQAAVITLGRFLYIYISFPKTLAFFSLTFINFFHFILWYKKIL